MHRAEAPKVRAHIVIASTRPGRVGPVIADWFFSVAREDNRFDTHLVDLADFALPVYDEPEHPKTQRYVHEHTRRWSESVAIADAFVFITPEYNYAIPSSLLNALTFVYKEWNYKPAAFVSYGGVAGGVRGVQACKTLLTTLRMAPIMDNVVIPFVSECVVDGSFVPNSVQQGAAKALLDELHRWASSLKLLREGLTVPAP